MNVLGKLQENTKTYLESNRKVLSKYLESAGKVQEKNQESTEKGFGEKLGKF